MKNKIILVLFLNFILFSGYAQQNLQVSTFGTPQSFVDMLKSGCMEISNVQYTGASNAIGSFTNGESLGLTEGVIMSTGNVVDAVGPNNTTALGSVLNTPGDPTFNTEFNAISSDAAVLEFDFVPHSWQVNFTYVFASDGYPETENSGAYDGLGIFITGPGTLGSPPYVDSSVAVVNGDYVNINNLNQGTNSNFFVNNTGGQYCEYDGYSTPFLVSLFVTPCQTYHMKIVIADVHPAFDSAVLMSAESLESDFLLIAQNYSTSGTLSDISESCENTLVITRLNQLDSLAFPFNITISGTSTEGVDFTGISTGQYEIPFMESYISIPYSAILDTMTEGIETIEFLFTHPSMCDTGCMASYQLDIDIIDNYPLVAGIVQSDTGICSSTTTYFTIETYIPANMDPTDVFYQWSSGPETTPSIVAEPPSGMQSVYCVTITDICDQEVVDCITITNSDFASINLLTADNLCFGEELGSVEVTQSGGAAPFTYSWDPVAIGNDSVGLIENLPNGLYEVTVTDSIGCSFNDAFAITSPDSIYYSLAVFEPKCHDGLDGSISFQMFEGIPPYSFSWSNGEISAGLDSIPAGSYSLTATDMNGCSLELPVEVTKPDQLFLTASQDASICLGQTLPLSAAAVGGTPSYYYFWSDGASGPNTSVTPSTSTIYTVVVNDINGCVSNTETINVSIYPAISVQLYTTDDSLCVGDETSIYADIQGGTGGPYMAIFSNGASSDILPPPYVVSPNTTTDYQVVIEDFCGSPTGFNELTISVFDPPEVNISADVYEGCKPLTVAFEDLNYEDGNEYHWNYHDGTNELLSYSAFPTHIFVNDGLYDITLDVTSKVGCKNVITSEELIYVWPTPTARFHANPEIASIIKPIIFFENESDDVFISYWDFGDNTEISNSESPEHIFNAVGQYNITLGIENEFGCVDEFTQTIRIRNEYTFYVPNAFSPGSAFPQNRTFKPVGEGIDPNNFHMIIYDRWGAKIYETFDLNHPWNGEVNGKPAELGASFPWVIIYNDLNGEQHQKSGSVTIVE